MTILQISLLKKLKSRASRKEEIEAGLWETRSFHNHAQSITLKTLFADLAPVYTPTSVLHYSLKTYHPNLGLKEPWD